jgi:hypothetical protein
MKVRSFEKYRVFACFATISIIPFLSLSIESSNRVVAGTDAAAMAASAEDAVLVCEAALFSSSGFARVREDAEHRKCLDDLAGKLEELKLQDPPVEFFIVIDGHRDSQESAEENLIGISVTRANNFRDFLVQKMGVDALHIKVRNFGDTCPAATPSAATSTAASTGELNRRVQIWMVAKGKEAPKDRAGLKCRTGSTPREITNEQPATSKDALPN